MPDFEDKVHAVSGDIAGDKLGLNESDQLFLKENIDIIFHSAATVKFNEPLRYDHKNEIIEHNYRFNGIKKGSYK